jgi:hypothetical protein
MDHGTRGLSMLGMPFFYCHDQDSIVGGNVCSISLNLSEMTGGMLKSFKTGILEGMKRSF